MDKPAILRRAFACLIVAATIFCLIALLTYNQADLVTLKTDGTARVDNWCGVVGANLAQTLMQWLGFASFLVVGLAAAWGVAFLVRKSVPDLWMKAFGAILLVSALAALLALVQMQAAWGGMLGVFYADVLYNYCGTQGGYLIVMLAGVFGLIFLGLDHYVVLLARRLAASARRLLAGKRSSQAAAQPAAQPGTQPAAALETIVVDTGDAKPAGKKEAPQPPPEKQPKPAEPDERSRQDAMRKRVEQRLSESIRRATQPPKMPKSLFDYRDGGEGNPLPPLDILDDPVYKDSSETQAHIENNIAILETTLADFNIGAEVVDIDRGPVVTRYELSLAPGIKVTKITSLADDISMAVKAPTVRIVAPIPGKSTVGVEIPNKEREIVRLKELLASKEYKEGKHEIPVFLGRDTSGTPVVSDLTRMPHLLIAGATGAGKSVCINSILLSILMSKQPKDMKLILVDPKMVELSIYEGIPHLLCPVVTDMKRAPWILEWATKQMDERYDVLSSVAVRHITQYNALSEEEIRSRLKDADLDRVQYHLPYIVIIIDELADLMMSSAKEIETSITRLAQKSRAVGIHILLATQRPSVDVITGLIKANMPTRISFQVTSKIDSRTILDRNGAEKLLGSGDMLFIPPGSSHMLRLQGAFVSDQEIKRVVSFVKNEGSQGDYQLDLDNWSPDDDSGAEGCDDDLYQQAVRIVLESQRGSVSLLQRKLEIGYTRASRLVDFMAKDGIVGSYKGSKAREVLMTLEEWEGSGRAEGYGAASEPDPA